MMRNSIILSYALGALLVVGSFGLNPAAAAGEGGVDYRDALEKSLLFFEAQRSGKLPSDQRVKWRADSGLNDGFLQGVNLVGGYYDSGDHVKFGLPMAFAITMLSWSAIEFEKEIAAPNQLEYTLDAIRWGTDYLIKAHKQPNVLWAQVGDGNSDHSCWERAEDMSTPRTAYKVDTEHPGSDIAGETAAAMAAASIAFRPYNSSYSKLLLLHAKQLFSFADTFRGQYDDSIDVVRVFYPSTGYSDELLWAAAWLFHATDDQYYLKYAVDNSITLGGTSWAVREFSWDNKYAGLQVLLAKVLMEDGDGAAYSSILKQYQAKAEYFLCACLQKNNGYNVPITPGGLLFVNEWNNMQYVTSSAFLLAVYSDYLSMNKTNLNCPDGQIQPIDLLKFAKSQADYILGKNSKSMSYLVGYKTNYPLQVHHRGASIAPKFQLASPVGCIQGFEIWYDRLESNPNVITGALVGGPDEKDEFSDKRSNYEQTEPGLVGNAPLIGLLAKLDSVSASSASSPGDAKATHPATSEVPVEFIHSITNTWLSNGTTYYRHRVTLKNTSQKPITGLKLAFENLSGPLWGLSPTPEKNIYELPSWLKVLEPGSQLRFVYVQEGPQAIVSILSYT